MAKRGLGRGLGSLIPQEKPQGAEGNGSREIPISRIVPNSKQPRRTFHEEELKGLAETITNVGIIEPLILRKKAEKFEIVAGERRWRAAKIAGLQSVPAVVREINDGQMRELALIENIQREDLNPVEEAMAYQELIEELSLKQDELAQRVGKSRVAITNSLRLLNLPESVQQYLIDGKLSAGHARALLSVRSKNQMQNIAEKAIKNQLSVRELEAITGRVDTKKSAKKKAAAKKNPELAQLEQQLEEAFGSPVSISTSKSGGKIEITFYDDDDLERILDKVQ